MEVILSKDDLAFFIQNPNKNWVLQNRKNEFLPSFISYYNPYEKGYLNPGETYMVEL